MYHNVFRRLRLFYAGYIFEKSPFYDDTEICFRPVVSRFQLHARTYYTLMQRLSSGPLEAETLQLFGFRRCTHG